MVFRRRGMALRPINRIKHVFDVQYAIALGTPDHRNLVLASDTPTLANTIGVETGSTVNGIFLNVEIVATTSAALSNCYLIVWKNPGGNLANIIPNTVGANDNKKYVIHQEMVMLQQQTNSNPRTLFKGVIVIPKHLKRFGPNDGLTLSTLSPGVNVNVCVQCHYKEFR